METRPGGYSAPILHEVTQLPLHVAPDSDFLGGGRD